MTFVTEPEKQIPVLHDVDVVVAGGSVSGVFAAMASARMGAETVLVERFGSVGGNMGPGMIVGGSLASGRPHPKAHHQAGVYPGFMGIPKEFIERHASLGGGSIPPYSSGNYLRDSNIASYTAMKMLEESGTTLVLSAFASDPIMAGDRVRGLFIENKSGRQAIKAKVVIDATGDADVARRAGAPILYPQAGSHEVDGHSPTGMGLYFVIGGVDWEKYNTFARQYEASAEEIAWADETLGEKKSLKYRHLLSFLKEAVEKGEYEPPVIEDLCGKRIEIQVLIARTPKWKTEVPLDGTMAIGGVSPGRIHEEIDTGDGTHISKLEAKLRTSAFEFAQLYRDYVPGFENSYLLLIAPFLGARGGPCIEGEYTLTMEDCRAGRRFDDVTYLYGEFRALRYTCEQGECKWTDMPYRVMLPKKIDGLIAVGRSASGIPDTLLRNRMAVKHMGQAGGTAAALTAKKDISPKELDIKELQRTLIDSGFYLGDLSRLQELGLVG